MDNFKNIFSEQNRMLSREDKETQLGQKSHVFWLYGLSGSGKSTLADAVERILVKNKFHVKLLDGDNLRLGLNKDLGFTNEARNENIRRASEVARLFLESGQVVICSFICPLKEYRYLAESIIGSDDFTKVYVKASFKACAKRDVKGLYAKSKKGFLQNFTGRDSDFEIPNEKDPDWIIDTENSKIDESAIEFVNKILPLIQKK